MKVMKKLALALALLPVLALAQEPTKVSVKAKGDDVRVVLANIFEQAKKQYVLPPNFRFALFLNLEDQEFEKALSIVCKQTGLETVIEDGVYHVRVLPRKPTPEPVKEEPKPLPKPVEAKPVIAPPKPVSKPGILSPHVLARKVTTRMQKADLRAVFTAIGQQAKVPIEVDPEVPAYKLDAFLIKTSLKYALDRITSAAGLEYRFTDHGTILILKP